MFFTFGMCSFILFKGKLRYFASGICQQQLWSSEGTCPTAVLFLSLSLARSTPFPIMPLISACPQMGQVLSLTGPHSSQTLLDPLFPLAPTFPLHPSPLSRPGSLLVHSFLSVPKSSWLLSCLHLDCTSSSSISPDGGHWVHRRVKVPPLPFSEMGQLESRLSRGDRNNQISLNRRRNGLNLEQESFFLLQGKLSNSVR